MCCVLAFVRLWQKEVRPHGFHFMSSSSSNVQKRANKREIDQMSNVKDKKEKKGEKNP